MTFLRAVRGAARHAEAVPPSRRATPAVGTVMGLAGAAAAMTAGVLLSDWQTDVRSSPVRITVAELVPLDRLETLLGVADQVLRQSPEDGLSRMELHETLRRYDERGGPRGEERFLEQAAWTLNVSRAAADAQDDFGKAGLGAVFLAGSAALAAGSARIFRARKEDLGQG